MRKHTHTCVSQTPIDSRCSAHRHFVEKRAFSTQWESTLTWGCYYKGSKKEKKSVLISYILCTEKPCTTYPLKHSKHIKILTWTELTVGLSRYRKYIKSFPSIVRFKELTLKCVQIDLKSHGASTYPSNCLANLNIVYHENVWQYRRGRVRWKPSHLCTIYCK